MLILASISGIQDFLFDVRESGGGQARSLRHRSFRIQLIAECAALRLLEAAGVPLRDRDRRLLFCAAAKVAIDAQGLSNSAVQDVRTAAQEMNRWLLNEAHGRLRLSVAIEPSNGRFADVFERANRSLAAAKLRPFQPASVTGASSWGDGALIAAEPYDPDAEAGRDGELGRQLVGACWFTVHHVSGRLPTDSVNVLGLSVTLDNREPAPSDGLLSCSNLDRPEARAPGINEGAFRVRRLARHIPRDDRGNPVEFVDLARHSRGAHMLGVLKADADSLGAAVRQTLTERQAEGPAALRTLSDALDRFIAETLEQEKRRQQKQGEQWNLIYTVFSGGDDLLAVGPWNIMLDFAGHMRTLFERDFGPAARGRPCPSPLTISAGVAIVKPMYPVHLAARQADDLLDEAKGRAAPGADSPKDQCAALGGVWKWAEHERVIGDARQLADWAEAGVIERGWLYTLLELALLRRGQAGPEFAGVHPAAATSRLAYHVARNWRKYNHPHDDRQRAANAAREWVDAVLDDFDAEPTEARGRVAYLPTIVRYAMLATRGTDSGERV